MDQFEKILCVVDPTQHEQPALNRAVWLAKQTGAEIQLLLCYFNEFLCDYKLSESHNLVRARKEAIAREAEKLEKLALPLREAGLTVATKTVWAHPLDEGILKQTIDLAADVVFKEAHYHSALSRALFSNTDWSLIRNCPVPLWLVKHHDITSAPTIIAAVDPFNEHDKPAALDGQLLRIGTNIADSTQGELHVFHAFDPRKVTAAATMNTYTPMPISMPALERQFKDAHQERLFDLADSHNVPSARRHLDAGMVRTKLPELATDLDAALVIMGAVSRSKLKRLIVGATAEETLSRVPCDLLVVKPNPFSEAAESDIRAMA